MVPHTMAAWCSPPISTIDWHISSIFNNFIFWRKLGKTYIHGSLARAERGGHLQTRHCHIASCLHCPDASARSAPALSHRPDTSLHYSAPALLRCPVMLLHCSAPALPHCPIMLSRCSAQALLLACHWIVMSLHPMLLHRVAHHCIKLPSIANGSLSRCHIVMMLWQWQWR